MNSAVTSGVNCNTFCDPAPVFVQACAQCLQKDPIKVKKRNEIIRWLLPNVSRTSLGNNLLRVHIKAKRQSVDVTSHTTCTDSKTTERKGKMPFRAVFTES